MLITVLFSMKRKGMPKALLHMQVHVCVCVCVCHGCVCEGVYMCVYAHYGKVTELSTVYLVRPKALCRGTHTSLHTHSGDVPHTHTYLHTHTHIVLGTYTHHLHNICTHTHGQCIQTCLHTASQTTKYDTIHECVHVSLCVWLFAYVVHSHLPTTALAKRTLSDSCSVTCKPPWVDTALRWE